jgi:hypothetical protein
LARPEPVLLDDSAREKMLGEFPLLRRLSEFRSGLKIYEGDDLEIKGLLHRRVDGMDILAELYIFIFSENILDFGTFVPAGQTIRRGNAVIEGPAILKPTRIVGDFVSPLLAEKLRFRTHIKDITILPSEPGRRPRVMHLATATTADYKRALISRIGKSAKSIPSLDEAPHITYLSPSEKLFCTELFAF